MLAANIGRYFKVHLYKLFSDIQIKLLPKFRNSKFNAQIWALNKFNFISLHKSISQRNSNLTFWKWLPATIIQRKKQALDGTEPVEQPPSSSPWYGPYSSQCCTPSPSPHDNNNNIIKVYLWKCAFNFLYAKPKIIYKHWVNNRGMSNIKQKPIMISSDLILCCQVDKTQLSKETHWTLVKSDNQIMETEFTHIRISNKSPYLDKKNKTK